jgi:phosphoribosylformimino-5-aminoimidazole carboxamide ribotide isomerase
MEGIDRTGVAAALAASPHPMWVSGGVTTLDELEFLDEHDAAGVVLGMALYTGTLDADEVARRYGATPSPNGS